MTSLKIRSKKVFAAVSALSALGFIALQGCTKSDDPGDKPATRGQMPSNVNPTTGKPSTDTKDAAPGATPTTK